MPSTRGRDVKQHLSRDHTRLTLSILQIHLYTHPLDAPRGHECQIQNSRSPTAFPNSAPSAHPLPSRPPSPHLPVLHSVHSKRVSPLKDPAFWSQNCFRRKCSGNIAKRQALPESSRRSSTVCSSVRSSVNFSIRPACLRRLDTAASHLICVRRSAPGKTTARFSIPLRSDFLPAPFESASARPTPHNSPPNPSAAPRVSFRAASHSHCSPNPVSNRSASRPDQKPAPAPSNHLFFS